MVPAASVRARLGVRLLRSLAKDWPVTLDAVLAADGVLPLPLSGLTIATSAEPDFSGGRFASDANESVDLGDAMEWVLHVRNGGDGTARLVKIEIASPDSLIYVPNSTTVNDVPVRDAGALPPFAAPRAIVLNEVDPGVEAALRWRCVVHNELAAGAQIVYHAQIRYDGERCDQVVSAELRVRAAPIFANAIPGLPFGLDGVLGPALAGQPRALAEERFLQLPPATPVGDGNGAHPLAALSTGSDELIEGVDSAFYQAGEAAETTGTLTALTPQRLERALRPVARGAIRRLSHPSFCAASVSSRRNRRRTLRRALGQPGSLARRVGSSFYQVAPAELCDRRSRRGNAVAALGARASRTRGGSRARRSHRTAGRDVHPVGQLRTLGVAKTRRTLHGGSPCNGAALGGARTASPR